MIRRLMPSEAALVTPVVIAAWIVSLVKPVAFRRSFKSSATRMIAKRHGCSHPVKALIYSHAWAATSDWFAW